MNVIVAAIALAIVYFSPKLFCAIIAFIALVVLYEVFRFRKESRAGLQSQPQEKRGEEDRQPCGREDERRYFRGIGVETDYARLLKDWGEGYRGGENHEVDLAWIQTFGPEKLRNYESAWGWLSLGKARNAALRSYILSQEEQEEVQRTLESRVAERVRRRIADEAASEAYREFVAGK